MVRRKLLKFNVKRLVDDLGGPTFAAQIAGTSRTSPYRWIRAESVSSRILERFKTARPDLDLDDYFDA